MSEQRSGDEALSGNPRVLVAEDDEILRRLLAAIAARAGCTAAVAAHGGEAVELLRTSEFDLVILDLMMPVLSGYDVIAHVAALPQRPAVIVVTAMDGERYLDLDPNVVTAIIRKPFDTDALSEMLAELGPQLASRRRFLPHEAGANRLRVC